MVARTGPKIRIENPDQRPGILDHNMKLVDQTFAETVLVTRFTVIFMSSLALKNL